MIKPALTKGKKELSDKKEMIIMRCLIVVFLVISVVLAFNKNASISTLMSYSWGGLAGAFLGPFMFALFSDKITKTAVYVSFIVGIGITLFHMFVFSLFPDTMPELVKWAGGLRFKLDSPVNIGAVSMIISIVITPLVSLFTKSNAIPVSAVADNA
jgi:SSS family solute:Na+ symporter